MKAKKAFGRNLFFTTVLLLAAYLPVVYSNFMHHDDYWLLDVANKINSGQQCRDLNQYYAGFQIGRPLTSEMVCLLAPMLTDTTDEQISHTYTFFKSLRLLNLLGFIAVFCSLTVTFRNYFRSNFFPLVIPALILFLPGIGVFISWGLTAVYMPGLIFLVISLLLARKLSSLRSFRQIKESTFLIPSALSVLSLFICFNFYPSTGFLYLCLPMTIITLSTMRSWKKFRLSAYLQIFIFTSSCVTYLFFHKIIVANILKEQIIGKEARSVSIGSFSEIVDRLDTFFAFNRNFFWRAANLWFLDIKNSQSNYIVAIILSGLFLAIVIIIIKLFKRGLPPNITLLCAGSERISLVIFILSCAGFLAVAHELVHQSRILVAIAANIVILLIWAITYWTFIILKFLKSAKYRKRILNGFGFVGIIITGLTAQYNTTQYFAQTSIMEMSYFESRILPLLRKDLDGLILIRPKGNFFIPGHEYGMPTSRWIAQYGIEGMLQMVARKYNLDYKSIKIKGARRGSHVLFYRDGHLKNIDIMDMNNFVFRKQQKSIPLNSFDLLK